MKHGVVAFTVPERGHLHRMLPVVAGLCEAGIPVHFFADADARHDIERTGARFVDLYTGRPVDGADASSCPEPIRYVSFAGHYGDDVVRDVALLRPKMVLHDTFAVIGRVVAFHLKLCRIDIRAGHNLEPTRTLEALRRDVPIMVSDQCLAAVRVLKERHGMADASPFSYFTDNDADLNLYAEPPEFLRPDERGPFEPLAFFGSYWPSATVVQDTAPSPFGCDAADRIRVYISFGTVIWRHFKAEAMAALEVMVDALGGNPGITVLISLGGHEMTDAAARLTRPNVRVRRYVDQIRVLQDATVYVTHHGLNSTHEAAFHGVPMISYPFFGDQLGLATRCQELGIAIPLGPIKGGPVTVNDVQVALAKVVSGGDALHTRMLQARAWETAVISRRPEVIQRITTLGNSP